MTNNNLYKNDGNNYNLNKQYLNDNARNYNDNNQTLGSSYIYKSDKSFFIEK